MAILMPIVGYRTENSTLPLPSPLTSFYVSQRHVSDSYCYIDGSFVKPSVNCSGVLVLRKEGSYPVNINDGTTVYDSTGSSFSSYTSYSSANGIRYYYRGFPYNSNREFQTELTAGNSCLITVVKPEGE